MNTCTNSLMSRIYKNMEIFQLSYNLSLDIHRLLDKFPEKEKDNITSQMRRAATSIPLNIAEGSVKKSFREFLNFLGYAYGSAKELDVLLSMSKDLNYITKKDYGFLFSKLDGLIAKLFSFMENIESRFEGKKRFFTKCQKPQFIEWWHVTKRKTAQWFLSRDLRKLAFARLYHRIPLDNILDCETTIQTEWWNSDV